MNDRPVFRSSLMMFALLLSGQLGCSQSRTELCSPDLLCPARTSCVEVNGAAICVQDACGDGFLEPRLGEACDDGNRESGDGCSADCRSTEGCGNGVLDVINGEECDDGNAVDTDACTSACLFPRCDNEVLDGDEADVDCGGACGPGTCLEGQVCASTADCAAGICVDQICQPLRATGQDCQDTAECAAGICFELICQPLRALGQTCAVTRECAEGLCIAGTCQEIAAVNLWSGATHSCAQLNTGPTRCWGKNDLGQLGLGHNRNVGDRLDNTPALAGDLGLDGVVRQIAGLSHTCAVLDTAIATGVARCWGQGGQGQLGYGTRTSSNIAALAGNLVLDQTIEQIVTGGNHTCARLTGGAVRCWGGGAGGALGYGNENDILDASQAGDVSLGAAATQLAAGDAHTCALLTTRDVRCWGRGELLELGNATADTIGDDELPSAGPLIDFTLRVVEIAAGHDHTCARLEGGVVRCWGRGDLGQLGNGDTATFSAATSPVVPIGGAVRQIAAHGDHTCALLTTGSVRCWGEGAGGKLGYGSETNIGDTPGNTPQAAGDVPVSDPQSDPVTAISVGLGHSCALLRSGAVRCWGDGGDGRLGSGRVDNIGDDETAAFATDAILGQ